MTRDDIIRMADEADLWADQELQCIGEYHPDWHEVRDVRFAALVAAAEREACAKVCDDQANRCEKAAQSAIEDGEHDEVSAIRSTAWKISVCADAIRARGQA